MIPLFQTCLEFTKDCVYWFKDIEYNTPKGRLQQSDRRRFFVILRLVVIHYGDVIMSAMSSRITSLKIVYSTVYSGADQRNHQSSASLAFVWGIHRWPVNSPHKGPVTRKMFPFDDVIMPMYYVYNWKYVIFKTHDLRWPLNVDWNKILGITHQNNI